MNALAPIARPLTDVLDANEVVGERKTGPRRYWTTREEKILRANFPTLGVPGCLPLLPGRSASGIYGHAHSLGVKGPLASKPDFRRQRWTSTPAIDDVIRRQYPLCTKRNDVVRLAKAIGRPRWWTSKRAVSIGVATPRFKEPDWTDAELAIALENAHRPLSTIQAKLKRAGFQRTEIGIKIKLRREGADRHDPKHFTAGGLATLMGVDNKVVTSWIIKGWLKAKRRGTARSQSQGGDQWWIHRKDVRAFVMENTAAVDLRKVDKFWFVDLLTNRDGA